MKIICVPKDRLALHRLDYDLSESDDLIELGLDDDTFTRLFEVQFFQKINDIANSTIDDFEDEKILGLNELRKVLDSDVFKPSGCEDKLEEIVLKIENLFRKALDFGTGVFFFF